MTSPSVVGRYVRVDPLNIETDVLPLWDALGGNPKSVDDRLEWFGAPSFREPKGLQELLLGIEEQHGWCVNVFRLQMSGEVCGMASYLATVPEHGTTEVGYVAHGSSMARSPSATEAHYLLAKHAFETMGYRRYEWKCDSRNEPSRKAALRLGFQYEGCFRQHRVTARKTNRDTSWFSMLDSEWPKRKDELEEWLSPGNFDSNGIQLNRLEDVRESRAS